MITEEAISEGTPAGPEAPKGRIRPKADPAVLARLTQIKEKTGLPWDKLALKIGVARYNLDRYRKRETYSHETESAVRAGLARIEEPPEVMSKEPEPERPLNNIPHGGDDCDPPKFASIRYELIFDNNDPSDTIRLALIINGRIESEFHHDEKMFRRIMATCATAIDLIQLRRQARKGVNKL